MKTYVSDYYQVTLMDNDGVDVCIGHTLRITYNPDNKKFPWTIKEDYTLPIEVHSIKASKNITGLGLLKPGLLSLHEALELVGKQGLMDNEIVFVDNKKEE